MADQFADTNVLLYAVGDVAGKTVRAQRALEQQTVINVQVLNEFVRVMTGKIDKPWPAIDAYLAEFRQVFEVLPLTLAVHERGVTVAKRYGYRIFDSMLLAAALEAGCTTFLSEDLQHGQLIEGRLRIENPFL